MSGLTRRCSRRAACPVATGRGVGAGGPTAERQVVRWTSALRRPSWLACLLLASTSGISCQHYLQDPEDLWAAYVAAAQDCSGSWVLGPFNADTVPGAPPCIKSLELEFSVAGPPPEGFSADGPFGTASVSFCGVPQVATVVSVRLGQAWKRKEPGSSEMERGERVCWLDLALQDGEAGRWTFVSRPVPTDGTITNTEWVGVMEQGLWVQFESAPVSGSSRSTEGSFGYRPALTYVRTE
jgi:hypothetical protein